MPRSVQDLLAERRANLNELRRERDAMARAMLQAHINALTAEIEKSREERAVQP